MKLVALHAFNYAGRRIRIGESFNAGSRDASVLVAIKRAQPDPAVPVASPMPAPAKRGRGRPRKASA